MEGISFIGAAIVGVLGAGAIAFGMTSWLLKRFIGSFEKKLDNQQTALEQINNSLHAIELLLANEYIKMSVFEARLKIVKDDVMKTIELAFLAQRQGETKSHAAPQE